MRCRHLALFISFMVSFLGCARPEPKVIPPEEQARKELVIGEELSRRVERQIKIQSDKESEVFLRNMALKLLEASPRLKDSPIGVFLVKDQWKSFSLPGIRIYLGLNALKAVDFENEVAALIAIELAHVENRDLFNRLVENKEKNEALIPPQMDLKGETLEKVVFFGPLGVLSFPEPAEVRAAERAVGILYRAGYDPRGVLSLLRRFEEHSAASPYESGTIEKMIVSTKGELARRAPLRNPVVRSQAFKEIQKRIRK